MSENIEYAHLMPLDEEAVAWVLERCMALPIVDLQKDMRRLAGFVCQKFGRPSIKLPEREKPWEFQGDPPFTAREKHCREAGFREGINSCLDKIAELNNLGGGK